MEPREAYVIGQIVEFKVKKLFGTYCELIDEQHDITSYLQGTANLILFIGQKVKCRILAVVEKHPKIELVNITEFEQGSNNLNEEKLTKLLSEKEHTWNTKDFCKLLLTEEKDRPFETQCHKWIQNLLDKKIDLNTVRHDCFDLLELSELLDTCSYNERDFYQDRLTLIIEQLGFYIKAANLIANETNGGDPQKTPTVFINNLFQKLQVSGFVYHPSRNFNILSSLFLRRPDLMNSRIGEMLDIIRHRDIKIWSKEPFGSALVKMLELYIRECDGQADKTKDNKKLIDNYMLALALQLLLLRNVPDTASPADRKLNATRLCIISSYCYPLNPKKLIEAAFICLFHSEFKFVKYTIDDLKLIPHYIANQLYGSIDTVNSFTQGRGRITVSSNGIQLQASAGEDEELFPVFPENMNLWKNMQVYLTSQTNVNLAETAPNNLMPYQDAWSEIESEFFNIKPLRAPKPKHSKQKHQVDDAVHITFMSQDENNRNKYYCRIEDEIGGEGEIIINDIVPYSVQSSLRQFFASDGSRLVFEAHITKVDDDGSFHFSMAKELKDRVFDAIAYNYDEEIICSLGGAPNYNMVPAISREGVSVSITNANKFQGIGRNSIVSCRLLGQAPGTFHILCEINEVISYGDFNINDAFKELLNECAIDRISERITKHEEEQIMESDRILDESYVRELILMVDRMALLEDDYIRSYNYLGFARIMCMLIGWESQATYYKGRMDIIAMLHFFARNSKVDEEKLKQLENVNSELFCNNVVLRERFMQLQAVSFINKPDHNAELFALANNNPELKELASLVLAYNITTDSNMQSTATDIHNKIMQKLNLKGFETGLKLYGEGFETEEVEYKTSIVYYAGDQNLIPNPDKQMEEILKVINSFINTRGGTLYVGVNDAGYGVGVEEDLNSPAYYNDKDKYLRAIIDAVAIKWGNNIATTYLQSVEFDKENTEKDVLIVKVKPYKNGLPFDGLWYVRKGGTKRGLTQEEFIEYQLKAHKPAPTISALDKIDDIVNNLAIDQPTAQPATELQPEATTEAPVQQPLVTMKDDEVHTSRIRHNVPAEYIDPDNYVEPIGLFKFISGGNFQKLNEYDYDDEKSLLTLVVKESESNGWLMLGYENGHIAKVSVRELLEYGQQHTYARNTDSKLLFASIATDNDAILTISKENKKHPKVVMRLDDVSKFAEGRLSDTGMTLYNESLVGEVLAYEIIPEKEKTLFSGIQNLKKTIIGSPNCPTTQNMVNTLHLWGITEI